VFTDLKNSGMLSNAKYSDYFQAGNVSNIPSINKRFIDLYSTAEDSEFINSIQTESYFQELRDYATKNWKGNQYSWHDLKLSDIDLTNCSYLEVVNETFFDSTSNLFITEKTFRPIAMGHIFLICGQSGMLAHLKQCGFQTFDDLFDESYDNITSFSRRWAIIKKNLQLWLSMSDADRKSYYMKSFDKLVHNQELLYSRDFKNEILELFMD
jgi:hypothetical protein